jgi:hypothetical protein
MPELRWTLLLLGALFIAVLAWSERRKARQSMRSGHDAGIPEAPASRPARDLREPALREPVIREPVIREPTLTLPELRAREPSPPQDLPVVHVEDESLVGLRLDGRRIEAEIADEEVAPPVRAADSGPVSVDAQWQPISAPESSVSDLPVLEADQTMKLSEAADTSAAGLELSVPAMTAGAPASQPATSAAGGPSQPAAGPMRASRSAERASGFATGSPWTADSEAVAMRAAQSAERTSGSAAGPPWTADSEAAPMQASRSPEQAPPDAGISSVAPSLPAEPAKPTAPIVDWPPEQDRRIIALRLVCVSPERFSGRAIRTALAAEGFIHGKFSIFHKPDVHNRAVLSAASLSKPGVFDLETIDSQRFSGLNLFAVLSASQSAREPFEQLLACARNLNERLEGGLQDDRGGPLTPSRIAALRETLEASPGASA